MYSGPFSDLSQECRDVLVQLAGIFYEIDCTILKEVSRDQNMFKAFEMREIHLGDWPRTDKLLTSRFDEIDLTGLRQSINDCSNLNQRSTASLLETLTNDKISRSREAWSTAVTSVFE